MIDYHNYYVDLIGLSERVPGYKLPNHVIYTSDVMFTVYPLIEAMSNRIAIFIIFNTKRKMITYGTQTK